VIGTDRACGVAVAGGYVYWANGPYVGSGTIGRALESGADADNTFIDGLGGRCGLAVDSNYLYFADGSTIDRADLSSSDPTQSTVQIAMGAANACGIAVDSLYAGKLTILRQISRGHGSVAITVEVSNPGEITVQERNKRALLSGTRARARRAGRLTITLRPTAAAAETLRAHRPRPVDIRITYLPAGGVTSIRTITVVLRSS
jgi:hypothetical protein